MILYLDTSALVKRYIDEAGTEDVRRWVDEAEMLATSVVTYPEAMSALARRWREGVVDAGTFEMLRSTVDRQWQDYAVIGVDDRLAGELAIRHGIRGLDAIHIAAALSLRSGAGHTTLAFATFDVRQRDAARAEGLAMPAPSSGNGE